MLEIAADLDTPVSVFLKIHALQPRFLWERTGGSGNNQGRYSIIGFGPAKETTLQQRSDAQLREAIAHAPSWSKAPYGSSSASFGGLIGYTGYDYSFGQASGEMPLASYIAPSSILVFDSIRRTLTLMHDGSEAEAKAILKEVSATLRNPCPKTIPLMTSVPRASMTEELFSQRVQRIQAAISSGDLQQAVLSLAFSGEASGDPFTAYRALRTINPAPYSYFLDLGHVQIAGASPQALIQTHNQRVMLRPIAGTRPRGLNPQEDEALESSLLADYKENAEHDMLVDTARHALASVVTPDSVVTNPYKTIERHRHVMHMVSGVEGKLRPGKDAIDAFRAVFPAGTTVGTPKSTAQVLLKELETLPREIYAGTVGWFGSDNRLEQAIAIRTMWFHKGQYRYQSGAGIVEQSAPEAEYQECLTKSRALREALELAKTFGQEIL